MDLEDSSWKSATLPRRLVHKPPLKGVTPHGVGRCPQGRGDRSVRGGPAKLVEGFFREVHLLVQPCQNRPAKFARTSLSAWDLPTPIVALACIGNVGVQVFSGVGCQVLFLRRLQVCIARLPFRAPEGRALC